MPALVLLAVIVVGVLVAVAHDSGGHAIYVDVHDATGLYAGEPIREAGIDVGGVASVRVIDHGRAARVGLTLHDEAWPLNRGARLALRWGGTISYLNGYLDLTSRGRSDVPYTDGAQLPSTALTVPVQFDTLIDDFTPSVRGGIRSLLSAGGTSLTNARAGLEQTLAGTPQALHQTDLVLGALDRSRTQLTGLIAAGGRVVGALDTARPSVQQLVSGAAGTLRAIASRASALEHSIARAPGTLHRVDTTLGTTNRTLDLAARLTTELNPGITQLHATLGPLQQLLETVEQVAPDAEATLTTAGRSAPQVTSLARTATALMPTIGSDVRRAIPELDCIRPYTPDIISFFTNWSAFMSTSDGHDYVPRVVPSAITGALSGAEQETPAQAIAAFPSLTDSFPQPPGYAADQPWFQPQCGISANVLDPIDDPEAGNPAGAPLPAPKGSAP